MKNFLHIEQEKKILIKYYFEIIKLVINEIN